MAVKVTGRGDLVKAANDLKIQGLRAMQNAIHRSTMFAHETLIDRMTALDLVDTGFARGSWVVSFPAPNIGRITSNCAYMNMLEYGWNGPMDVKAHTREAGHTWFSGERINVRAHTRMVHRPGNYFIRYTKRKTVTYFNKVLAEELARITK
jgi:hypothetical protein